LEAQVCRRGFAFERVTTISGMCPDPFIMLPL
jgi:hypothetical protein